MSVSVFEFVFEGGEREACRGGAKRGARSVCAMLTRLAGLTQRRDSPTLSTHASRNTANREPPSNTNSNTLTLTLTPEPSGLEM